MTQNYPMPSDLEEKTDWPIRLRENVMTVLERTKAKDPELFKMGSTRLWGYLQEKKMEPDAVTCMLRLKFWDEFKRADGAIMSSFKIYQDVCMEDAWWREINDPYCLSWILTPPVSLEVQTDERIDSLMRTLRPVTAVSPVDRNGKIDKALARLQFEMLMYFDQKRNGAIVQRIEQKNTSKSMNINVSQKLPSDSDKIAKMVENMSEQELTDKLMELRKNNDPPVVEVEAE